MEFVEKHLDVLKSIKPIGESWVGGKPLSYAQSVTDAISAAQLSKLPEKAVGRNALFDLASSEHAGTLTCCVAIFAWGGMRRDHARAVLKKADQWLPIADVIRTGSISRTDAYSQFLKARRAKDLPGMGPAFFTKLIYFLGKNASKRGYIMDQWTALSANLLTGRRLVELQKLKDAVRVSDNNEPHDYENFCQFIESLALELRETPDDAEMRIFSVGGRGAKRGEWRSYVKANAA